MTKNILVLTGSPRKNGNSEMLADAFIEGAKSAGHTVSKFQAGMKNIRGCIACDACWSKGRACSIDDDFRELEPMLERADVLVLVSPLYWFGITAQIKAAIDKMYAYGSKNCTHPLKIKESALIMCGETDVMNDFAGAMSTYQNMIDYVKWKDVGGMVVPCVNRKGDVIETGALDGARDLGKSI